MNVVNTDSFQSILYAPEIEKRFYRIYEIVISNYFASNKYFISNAKQILDYEKGGKNFKTDFLSYQLSFLLSFGVQDTILSARKFYESFMDHSKVIKILTENNQIKLLCLESESLPTVIGVCQAIDEITQASRSTNGFEFREIRISVIEARKKWKRLCEYIVDTVNSFFKSAELKLNFIEDFISLSSLELINSIGDLDIVVVARNVSEKPIFTDTYSFMQIISKEMRENAVLFCNDSFNENYNADLNHLISNIDYFSQISSCQVCHASFEELKDMDFPVYWDTDFQPVIFSIWIKDGISKNTCVKTTRVASNKHNTKKSKDKSSSIEASASKKHTSNSKIHINPTEHLSKLNPLLTSPQSDKYKVTKTSDIENQCISPSEKTKTINEKRTVKSSAKNCNINAAVTTQTDVSKDKSKSHSSDISKTAKISTTANPSFPTSTQTNVMNGKMKVKSSTNNCNPGGGHIVLTKSITYTDSGMLNNELHLPNMSALQKQINDSRITKSFQKSPVLNVSPGVISSQKAISKMKSQINSSVKLGYENSTTEITLSKKKNKTTTSNVPNASSEKMIIPNQEEQTVLSKQIENASLSVKTPTVPKENNKVKTSKKPSKDKNDPELTTLKGSFSMKSNKRAAVPVKLTKKTVKNNATEKIKLTGKFAYMDLEKKNKDERHKMRAKNVSFQKYAIFDYDD